MQCLLDICCWSVDFPKMNQVSGMKHWKQFLLHQCKVGPELFSCLVDQEKHPASCHLDTCGWYSYWLKFTFTQTSSHTYKLSHNHHHHHHREVSLSLTTLLSSSALTSTYHVTPCLQSQHCNGKLRTFFHRNFSFTKMIFWLIKILHITYVKYYINNSEQQILYILHFRLRTANLTFRFQFQFIWLVLVLWWQFPFINFLFV